MSVTSNSRAGSPDDFTLVSFNEVLSIENENSRKAQKAIEKLMSKQNRTILNFEKKKSELRLQNKLYIKYSDTRQ